MPEFATMPYRLNKLLNNYWFRLRMPPVPAWGGEKQHKGVFMRIDLDINLIDPKPFVGPLHPSDLDQMMGNVVVIHLKGSLVQGAAVSFFLEQIRLLVGRGISNLVIDLLHASNIDDRGAGGLAAAYNAIRDARGKIKYILDSQELLSVLGKNHLDHVFEIFQDEASALTSFCGVAK